MVTVEEAKEVVLPLILRDLRASGLEDRLVQESPDPRDPGKFLLDDKPARVISYFSGYMPNINLDWFDGSMDLPTIQGGQFYWYVFAFTGTNGGEVGYFVCPYTQVRSWALEFDAPKGNDHRDHHDWRCSFIFPDNGKPWFYWGDDPSESPRNSGREITLNNVTEVLSGEEREGKIWCIYVGKKPETTENFRIGIEAGKWGFSFEPASSDFQQGDRALFFHHCSSGQAPVPPGYPRVGSLEDFCPGVAKHVVEAQVSKSLYQTQEGLWPDGAYPFRFDFEQIGESQDLKFTGDLFGEDLMDTMRRSACTPHNTFSIFDDGRMLLTKREGEKVYEGYTQDSGLPLSAEDREFIEGKPQLVTHLRKERDSGVSLAKREEFKREHGKLFCEHCKLDPVEEYGGEQGESCIEVHHTIPVAEMEPDHSTTLEELQCLCANCHRVEHRRLRDNS